MWLLPTFFWPGEKLPVEPIFPFNLIGNKFPEDPNAEANTRRFFLLRAALRTLPLIADS